jgi:hypothetical protein
MLTLANAPQQVQFTSQTLSGSTGRSTNNNLDVGRQPVYPCPAAGHSTMQARCTAHADEHSVQHALHVLYNLST